MQRLFDLSQSEPDYDCMACEIEWIYEPREGQALWTMIWLSVIFSLCLIASCQHQPALTRGYPHEAIKQQVN